MLIVYYNQKLLFNNINNIYTYRLKEFINRISIIILILILILEYLLSSSRSAIDHMISGYGRKYW